MEARALHPAVSEETPLLASEADLELKEGKPDKFLPFDLLLAQETVALFGEFELFPGEPPAPVFTNDP